MALKFFHSKLTLACILHGIKDACDQGFNVKKRKKKAIQCYDWRIYSMRITTDIEPSYDQSLPGYAALCHNIDR